MCYTVTGQPIIDWLFNEGIDEYEIPIKSFYTIVVVYI